MLANLFFNVSLKCVKSKVAHRPVYNVPSKPVKSKFSGKTWHPVNSCNPVYLAHAFKPIDSVNSNKIGRTLKSDKPGIF